MFGVVVVENLWSFIHLQMIFNPLFGIRDWSVPCVFPRKARIVSAEIISLLKNNAFVNLMVSEQTSNLHVPDLFMFPCILASVCPSHTSSITQFGIDVNAVGWIEIHCGEY